MTEQRNDRKRYNTTLQTVAEQATGIFQWAQATALETHFYSQYGIQSLSNIVEKYSQRKMGEKKKEKKQVWCHSARC